MYFPDDLREYADELVESFECDRVTTGFDGRNASASSESTYAFARCKSSAYSCAARAIKRSVSASYTGRRKGEPSPACGAWETQGIAARTFFSSCHVA